jgi:hypothetical protein
MDYKRTLVQKSIGQVGNASGVPEVGACRVLAAATPAFGLSNSAYLTKNKISKEKEIDKKYIPDMSCRLFRGASYLDFVPSKCANVTRKSRVGGGIRGSIKGLSRASRNNLVRQFSKIDREHLVKGLFVTLTYHWVDDYGSLAVSKRHLDSFFKRIRYKYPKAGWVWRLEPQARGVAHYHVVILGVEHIPHAWIAKVWNRIAAPGDLQHLAAGTQVKRVKDYKGASGYVAKYLQKDKGQFEEEYTGRWWGSGGQLAEYLGEVVKVRITGAVAVSLFRSLDKYRLSVARSKKKGRSAAIVYARRRRYDFKSRWYLCDVNAVIRLFIG